MTALEKPFTTDLDQIVAEYERVGMKIIPVGNIGRPQELREMLRIRENDFCVCAYMASSPSKIPGIKEVVRTVAETLGRLDAQYDLDMPMLSGGGNYLGAFPDENTSLMGEWAYGATRNDRMARFVITQGLIQKEGLPLHRGVTVCLKQLLDLEDDLRLGARTDGLLYGGDLGVIFPGGGGTLIEKLDELMTISINTNSIMKKLLLIDPVFQDPITTSAAPFWAGTIHQLTTMNHAGTISDRALRLFNEHCLVYRPDASLGPSQMSAEITSIILAIRAEAHRFNPNAGYAPIRGDLLTQYLIPLVGSGTISQMFDGHALQDRSWGSSLRYLSQGNPLDLRM